MKTNRPADADELRDIYVGGREPLPPADVSDPVIDAYKKDVDRTLLRENLKLSPQQRSEKFLAFMKGVRELQRIANQDRRK